MTEVMTVRLGDLAPDPVAIADREDRLGKIDDLLASLPALGQLQSLRVRPWTGTGTALYGVTAGNRRLAALRRLAEDGGSVQGVVVTDDFPVHVIFGEADDGVAFAGTVAENVQRLPETVVGEFRAFAKMAETATVKDIAATFGVPEKRVQQRMKLAALHPDVIAALEAGTIKLDAAEAFTLAEPDKQAEFLASAQGWQLEAYYVKRQFTDKLITAGSPIGRIIGAEAYIKAGGKVLGDAFSDTAYWISTDLVDKLLAQHWERETAKWKAEGWSFVETIDQFCKGDRWELRNQHEHLKPAEEGSGDEPTYSAAQKAGSGVVYFEDGSEAPHFGVMREVSKPTGHAAPAHEPELYWPPHAARKLLTETLDRAVVDRISGDRLLALRVLVATLKESNEGYFDGKWEQNVSPLAVVRDFPIDERIPEQDDDGSDEPRVQLSDAIASVRDLDLDGLLNELTRIVGRGVHHTNNGIPGAYFEMVAPQPEFDARAYFMATDRAFILHAWKDMTDPDAGEKPLKGSAEIILDKAVKRAADTGWMPPQLRMPGYAGPHFLDVEDATDEGDAGDEAEQLQAAE